MADFSTEVFSEQCYTSNINLRLSLTTSEGPGGHDPPPPPLASFFLSFFARQTFEKAIFIIDQRGSMVLSKKLRENESDVGELFSYQMMMLI